MQWTYRNTELTIEPKHHGYVYSVQQLSTGRVWIGAGLFVRICRNLSDPKITMTWAIDWQRAAFGNDELQELYTENPEDFDLQITDLCVSEQQTMRYLHQRIEEYCVNLNIFKDK